MKLLHLKIACYLYNQFTDYDKSYLELLMSNSTPDMNNRGNTIALIKWLRSWRCRQFKNDNENTSITSLQNWYRAKESYLPNINLNLIDYDLDINESLIIDLFDNLSNRKVSVRKQKKRTSDVHVGPVGAAKTLFALRPNLFAPWDKTIYKEFKLKGNGSGYVSYLSKIKNELKNIRDELNRNNLKWENIFSYLNKKHCSYPKLIDEYYWVTITNKCDPLKIENIYNKEYA